MFRVWFLSEGKMNNNDGRGVTGSRWAGKKCSPEHYVVAARTWLLWMTTSDDKGKLKQSSTTSGTEHDNSCRDAHERMDIIQEKALSLTHCLGQRVRHPSGGFEQEIDGPLKVKHVPECR